MSFRAPLKGLLFSPNNIPSPMPSANIVTTVTERAAIAENSYPAQEMLHPRDVRYSTVVPLPRLSDHSIRLNPLLQYHSPTYQDPMYIHYDLSLPPQTASLSFHQNNHDEDTKWWTQAAMHPAHIPSLTIRFEQTYSEELLERPIVILQFNAQSGIVTIRDVLQAVHARLLELAGMHLAGNGHRRWNYPHYASTGMLEDRVYQLLRGRKWWKGLRPSNTEDDVWLLETGCE